MLERDWQDKTKKLYGTTHLSNIPVEVKHVRERLTGQNKNNVYGTTHLSNILVEVPAAISDVLAAVGANSIVFFVLLHIYIETAWA